MEPNIVVDLWPNHPDKMAVPEKQERPRLEVYFPKNGQARPCVLVCPGGGYCCLAPHEARPIAERMVAEGFSAAVVYYRHAPAWKFPAPYDDACRAIRLLRANAGAWHVDAGRIALLGFSAGGHLTATVGTQPGLNVAAEDDLAGSFSGRPDRIVLCYAVISMSSEHHEGSACNLLGKAQPTQAERWRFSNELHVTPENPPAFLWHTADDQAVPVSNSLRYAAACAKAGVPFALHVFPSAPHGIGLAEQYNDSRAWPSLLATWLGDWPDSVR